MANPNPHPLADSDPLADLDEVSLTLFADIYQTHYPGGIYIEDYDFSKKLQELHMSTNLGPSLEIVMLNSMLDLWMAYGAATNSISKVSFDGNKMSYEINIHGFKAEYPVGLETNTIGLLESQVLLVQFWLVVLESVLNELLQPLDMDVPTITRGGPDFLGYVKLIGEAKEAKKVQKPDLLFNDLNFFIADEQCKIPLHLAITTFGGSIVEEDCDLISYEVVDTYPKRVRESRKYLLPKHIFDSIKSRGPLPDDFKYSREWFQLPPKKVGILAQAEAMAKSASKYAQAMKKS